jgi:hypothetical protein
VDVEKREVRARGKTYEAQQKPSARDALVRRESHAIASCSGQSCPISTGEPARKPPSGARSLRFGGGDGSDTIEHVSQSSSPTLVFQWLEREKLAVVYQGSQRASQDEWQAYMAFLRGIANIEHRALVHSGCHASRSEQEELRQATSGSTTPHVALISPSTAVRFIASMFTLLNRNLRYFAPSEFGAALGHLGCTPEETLLVTRAYEGLRDQVEASYSARPARSSTG